MLSDLTRDQILQRVWLHHLSLRSGITEMLERVHTGEPPSIDWSAVNQAEVAANTATKEREKWREKVDYLLFLAGAVKVVTFIALSVSIPVRGLIGFGVAWVLTRYLPDFA